MHQLSGFQRDLLVVISSMDDPDGQDIKRELQESQRREIGHSRLYTNLDRLVEKGFVEKSRNDGRSNSYGATERGKQKVQQRFAWERRYFTGTT